MEWSKIKTIILIILAGTNLLLLSFVLRQDLQKRTVQLQARQEAVAFLEKNGVTVEENIIPKEDTLQPQQVERDRESEPKLAQALLGGQVEERLISLPQPAGLYPVPCRRHVSRRVCQRGLSPGRGRSPELLGGDPEKAELPG